MSWFFWHRSLWNLISLTRDWTWALEQWKRRVLVTWPPGNSPKIKLDLKLFFFFLQGLWVWARSSPRFGPATQSVGLAVDHQRAPVGPWLRPWPLPLPVALLGPSFPGARSPCLLPASPPPSLSLAHSVPATRSSSLFLQHSRPSHAPEPLHWLSTQPSHGASLTSFRSSCSLLPDPSHLGHSY